MLSDIVFDGVFECFHGAVCGYGNAKSLRNRQSGSARQRHVFPSRVDPSTTPRSRSVASVRRLHRERRQEGGTRQVSKLSPSAISHVWRNRSPGTSQGLGRSGHEATRPLVRSGNHLEHRNATPAGDIARRVAGGTALCRLRFSATGISVPIFRRFRSSKIKSSRRRLPSSVRLFESTVQSGLGLVRVAALRGIFECKFVQRFGEGSSLGRGRALGG
jgi:hypothetical protein